MDTIIREEEYDQLVNYSSADNASITYLMDHFEEIKEFSEFYTFTDDLGVAYVYVAFIIIGLPANLIVLVVIGMDSQLLTKSSLLYAFNLAIADFMLLLFLPMNIHTLLEKEWVFGKLACSMNNSVKFVNMFVSIFMLMLMAVDRYLAVIRNSMLHRLSKYRNNPLVIGITCLLVWIFGFLAAYPNFTRSEFLADQNGQAECGINWWGENTTLKDEAAKCGSDAYINGSNVITGWRCRCGMTKQERTYNMHLFGWTFVLPLTCIVFSYSNIGYVIWKSSERTRSFSMTRADSRRSANTRTKRLMILIVTLIVVYIVCWTPYHLFHLLVYCGVKLDHDPCSVFEHVYNILIWSNSAVNPILYSFLGHGFKQKLYEVWKKIKRSWPCIRLVSIREHRTHYFGDNEHLVFTPSTNVPSYHHGKTNVVSSHNTELTALRASPDHLPCKKTEGTILKSIDTAKS